MGFHHILNNILFYLFGFLTGFIMSGNVFHLLKYTALNIFAQIIIYSKIIYRWCKDTYYNLHRKVREERRKYSQLNDESLLQPTMKMNDSTIPNNGAYTLHGSSDEDELANVL